MVLLLVACLVNAFVLKRSVNLDHQLDLCDGAPMRSGSHTHIQTHSCHNPVKATSEHHVITKANAFSLCHQSSGRSVESRRSSWKVRKQVKNWKTRQQVLQKQGLLLCCTKRLQLPLARPAALVLESHFIEKAIAWLQWKDVPSASEDTQQVAVSCGSRSQKRRRTRSAGSGSPAGVTVRPEQDSSIGSSTRSQ